MPKSELILDQYSKNFILLQLDDLVKLSQLKFMFSSSQNILPWENKSVYSFIFLNLYLYLHKEDRGGLIYLLQIVIIPA